MSELKKMSRIFSKKNKLISAVLHLIYYAVFAVALVTVIYVLYCNSKGKAANLFGYSVMHVVTGSMEPVIHTDDYIFVRKTPFSSLKEGQVISFYSDDPAIYGMPNTHRITAFNDDGTLTVKGDANPVADAASVRPENIIGVYTGKASFFRFLYSFGSKKKLMMILVIIPTFLVSLYEAVTITRLTFKKDDEESDSQAEKERLIREAIDREKEKLYAENYSSDMKGDDEIESGKDNETEND